eukprot:CAMPEP_0180283594 /NCGR_PEP_ID=MMETSP0988-20121125/10597_1 /TAXON_ID=697907 /ORGANISM="non described non described, Strain CCMP2293" /LENGTH=155 /DNA_ID=CAMNT_0022256213 /DNA_START=458 /DNA_END=926 /DNA_ORIENTATION=+
MHGKMQPVRSRQQHVIGPTYFWPDVTTVVDPPPPPPLLLLLLLLMIVGAAGVLLAPAIMALFWACWFDIICIIIIFSMELSTAGATAGVGVGAAAAPEGFLPQPEQNCAPSAFWAPHPWQKTIFEEEEEEEDEDEKEAKKKEGGEQEGAARGFRV